MGFTYLEIRLESVGSCPKQVKTSRIPSFSAGRFAVGKNTEKLRAIILAVLAGTRPGRLRPETGRAARKEAVMLEALSLAAGLSWASGLRLYLTVFVAGLFERMGLVHLPDTLSVLGSPWVIGVAAVLAIVEFFADKIPAFDSLWDAIHTFIRIPAGAVLAVGAIGHADPVMLTIAALAGGTLAGAAHLAKAGTRALINLSPEPFSNWVASTTEDLGALIGITLALFVPVLFLFLIVAFLLFAGWALPRLVRGVRGGVSRMANHMVPRLNPRINSRINPLPSKHD
jgi:hypothetical protein